MSTFYAQPYDISAHGFYFEDAETYKAKINSIRNDYGEVVEEFEIQLIDSDLIDCEVCNAIGLYQSNIVTVIEKLEEWEDHEKYNIIIAVGECGYSFDIENDNPYDFDITIYEVDSLKDLAYQFVDEGLFGDIPANIAFYMDYDAMARDLSCDYTETAINGQRVALIPIDTLLGSGLVA